MDFISLNSDDRLQPNTHPDRNRLRVEDTQGQAGLSHQEEGKELTPVFLSETFRMTCFVSQSF